MLKNISKKQSSKLISWIPILSFLLLFSGVLLVKISDYDLWWHLSLGKEVVKTGALSLQDSFSHSFGGAEQFNGEWLSDLLMYGSYNLFGLPGVYLLKFLVLGLVFGGLYLITTLYYDKEQKIELATAILSLIVVLFAIRFRLFIRPYLFSYLFFVYFLFVLCRAQKGVRGAFFWGLLPIEILWANTSKGSFLGVLLVALYVVDRVFNKQLTRADLLALGGVFGASLLNPEGWRVYELLLGFASGDKALALTGEQQPLSFQMLWGGGWTYTVCYQILVLTGLVYFIVLKGWRNLFHLLSFLVLLGFSIALIRMIDFFALLSGLFFFLSGQAMLRRMPFLPALGANGALLAVSGFSLGLLFFFVPGNQTYAFGVGVKDNIFPEKAVRFMKVNNLSGKLFNSYPFGGYLTFFLPEEKVFVDGRGYHLYPTDFQTNYLRSIGEKEQWEKLDEKWGFEVALLEYDLMSFGRHFAQHLSENPGWALVFWDEKSAIYLKRLPKFKDIIEKHQYKIVRPKFNDFSYLNFLLKFQGERVVNLIEEDLQKNPMNQEVRLAKVFALYSLDRRRFSAEIKEELLLCHELYPEVAMEYSGLALLALEDEDRARARFLAQKSLSIDPSDPGGKFVMDKLKE